MRKIKYHAITVRLLNGTKVIRPYKGESVGICMGVANNRSDVYMSESGTEISEKEYLKMKADEKRLNKCVRR